MFLINLLCNSQQHLNIGLYLFIGSEKKKDFILITIFIVYVNGEVN